MRDADRPPKPKSPDSDVSPWALAGLGVQFAVALVLFGYLGQWVDARLGTAPFALLFGVLAGAGGTFVLSYRRIIAPRPPRTPELRSPADQPSADQPSAHQPRADRPPYDPKPRGPRP